MKTIFHKILASSALCLAAVVCPQVGAQAPESLNNHVLILHGGQSTHSLKLREGEEQPDICEEETPYTTIGATLVFETEELKLRDYQRENFGCARIIYQRLDEHNALLHYLNPDYSDMWTQQTLLVFESPTKGHYYEIEHTIGTNGARLTTIRRMGDFCLRQREDEPAGAYMGAGMESAPCEQEGTLQPTIAMQETRNKMPAASVYLLERRMMCDNDEQKTF